MTLGQWLKVYSKTATQNKISLDWMVIWKTRTRGHGHGKRGHGKRGHGKPGHGKRGHGKRGHGKRGQPYKKFLHDRRFTM